MHLADDGFGNLIEVLRAPFRLAAPAEVDRHALPPNFTVATGSYTFVMNDWLLGWGCNH